MDRASLDSDAVVTGKDTMKSSDTTATTDDGGYLRMNAINKRKLDNSVEYVAMDAFDNGKSDSISALGTAAIRSHSMDDGHYKVPPSPRPISTFKPYSSDRNYKISSVPRPGFTFQPASSSKHFSPARSPSSSPPPPPLPSSSPPHKMFFSSHPPFYNKPTLVPVKPPQIPSNVTRAKPISRTVTRIDISCDGVFKTSTVTTPSNVCDEVKKALDELSDLIDTSTKEISMKTASMESISPSASTSPPPSYTPWPSSSIPFSQSVTPGYLQPVPLDLEDLNRKLHMLVINVQAQNRKIDEIRRVCRNKGDYMSFDELDEYNIPFSNDQKEGLTSDTCSGCSTLPRNISSLGTKTDDRINSSSWSRKLIGCVKFGKNKNKK